MFFQMGGYSIKSHATLILFADTFKHPAFNQLRSLRGGGGVMLAVGLVLGAVE